MKQEKKSRKENEPSQEPANESAKGTTEGIESAAAQSSSDSKDVKANSKAKPSKAKTKDTKDTREKPQSTFVDGPTPLVTSALVIANLVVFGLMYKQDPTCLWRPTSEFLISAGADFGPLFAGGQWWRILTSGFVHCGAWHLLLNMCALYSIGGNIERRIGVIKYLLVYFCSLIAGSFLSLYVHPFVASAGASGAIFGLLGCQLLVILNLRHEVPRSVLINMLLSELMTLAVYLGIGYFIPKIDNFDHIGGLLGGLVCGAALMPLNPQKKIPNVLNCVATTLLVFVLLQTNTLVKSKTTEATDAMTESQKPMVRMMLKKYSWPFWLPTRLETPGEGVGDAAMQCPDYETAMSMVNKAIELSPADAFARYSRARVEHKFNHDLEALADVAKAISLKPDQYEFACLKARIELSQKQIAAAKGDVSEALKIKRAEHSEARDIDGCINLVLGNKAQARKDFDKAIAEDPESGGAYYHRGMLEVSEFDSPKAEQDYVRAEDKTYLPDRWDKEHNPNKAEVVRSRASSFRHSAATKEGETAKNSSSATFMVAMKHAVMAHWTPPGTGGTQRVGVCFRVNPNGSIQNLKVEHSSGSDEADRAALQAVTDSTPFLGGPANPTIIHFQFGVESVRR